MAWGRPLMFMKRPPRLNIHSCVHIKTPSPQPICFTLFAHPVLLKDTTLFLQPHASNVQVKQHGWSCIKKKKKHFLEAKVYFHCFCSSLSLSLFPECGWHRNPSKAFYQAFQSGSRLRDSKAHCDRYSTILDWTGQACKSVTMRVQCLVKESFAFSTCMDWVWKQSLAASARLANRLVNSLISLAVIFLLALWRRFFLWRYALSVSLKNSILFTAWVLLP